jgi:two-component system, NtrC family, response regulator AtoC
MSTRGLECLRVLVVEDELLIRWSIVETLTKAGCVVTDVADAAGALRATATEDFDAVVLDYRLPDSNDLNLLETLRDRLPRSTVVMMSAFGTPEITQQAAALGVHGFLDKPFEMEALKNLLASDVRIH